MRTIAISVIVFLFIVSPTIAVCPQEVYNYLNVANHTELNDTFTVICDLLNSLNISLNSSQSNLTQYYNNTDSRITSVNDSLFSLDNNTGVSLEQQNVTLMLLVNRTSSLEGRFDSLSTSVNNTLGQYEGRIVDNMNNLNSSIAEGLDNKEEELENIFDEKYKDLKTKFLSKEDYENYSSTLKTDIYNTVQYELRFWDRYATYGFILAVVAVVCIVAVLRFKPFKSQKPILKGFRPELKTVEDMTTKSDLKAKIDAIRGLKLAVVKSDFNQEQKIILLKKIDTNEIWDIDSLKKEMDLIRNEAKLKTVKKGGKDIRG